MPGRQRPLSPEFALVAACALLDDNALAAAAPRLLDRPGFDWERLADLADYHGAEQVVRAGLGKAAPRAMPRDFAVRLQHALMRETALQTAQAMMSVKVTVALAEAGVPALVLKGVGLAALLYAPAPELRGSNDIDILVAPENLDAADRALRKAGLSRRWPEIEPPEAVRPMLLRLANVFDYRGPAFDELVELHCRPTLNPYWMPVSFAECEAASVEVETGQGRVRTLDGPLGAAYLCQHALYYLGFRLKWFDDIARAVRRAGASGCAAYIGASVAP